MTIIFRFSTFAVVLVLTTKITVFAIENDRAIRDVSITHRVDRLIDEAVRHREEAVEAADRVRFMAEAFGVMAERVIRWCLGSACFIVRGSRIAADVVRKGLRVSAGFAPLAAGMARSRHGHLSLRKPPIGATWLGKSVVPYNKKEVMDERRIAIGQRW